MQQLSRKYLKSPDFIDLVGEDDVKIPTTITHWSYATQRDTRADILGLVATVYGSDKRSIVFTQVNNQINTRLVHAFAFGAHVFGLHVLLRGGGSERCVARARRHGVQRWCWL